MDTKITIVTVCKNAVKTIERTIRSVLEQSYRNIEYIIIDGKSDDGTMNIISKYSKMDSRIKYIHEKDRGLYDAMNKGAKLATGDIVEFLNAGDELYDNSVLQKVAKAYEESEKSQRMIFFGNIIYLYEDGTTNKRVYTKSCGKSLYFATGDCVNHQACFATRSCMCDFLKSGRTFDDETYRICADRDWMMRQSKAGAKWICLNETLIKYPLTSVSVSVADPVKLRQEELTCLKRHYAYLVPIYKGFTAMRESKRLSKLLHSVYKLLYISKH